MTHSEWTVLGVTETVVAAAAGYALWKKRVVFDGHSEMTGRGTWLYIMGLCMIIFIGGIVGLIFQLG
jgi:hypothetical protein